MISTLLLLQYKNHNDDVDDDDVDDVSFPFWYKRGDRRENSVFLFCADICISSSTQTKLTHSH